MALIDVDDWRAGQSEVSQSETSVGRVDKFCTFVMPLGVAELRGVEVKNGPAAVAPI